RSVQPGQQSSFFKEFAEGLRFFAGNHVLMTILIAVLIAILGAGAVNALGVFFITQNLHASPNLFGLMDAVTGIGVIAGAILASSFAQRLGVTRTFWVCVVMLGALFLIFARMTSLLPALVITLVM